MDPLPIKEEHDDDQDFKDTLAIVTVSTPPCYQSFPQEQPPSAHLQNTITQSSPRSEDLNHNRTLMPVTIKQIADAWCGPRKKFIVINNTVISSIKLIGQIKKKNVDTQKGTFSIEDCTGILDASIWFTCGRWELDCIRDRSYAMVAGRLKLDGPHPKIQCYVCRPVLNFNDITHHHLSVVATHIDLVIKPTKSVHERATEAWAREQLLQESSKAHPVLPPTTTIDKKLQTAKGKEKMDEYVGHTVGNPILDSIMQILKQEQSRARPDGVHIDLICTKLLTEK